MDRFRQKAKKEKAMKHVEKEKLFITDVKTIKENLKIKEILRSVKMNSSMRIKAPRGSVVMNNNDFTDGQEGLPDENNCTPDISKLGDLQEATNSDLVNQLQSEKTKFDDVPLNNIMEQQNNTENQEKIESVPVKDSIDSLNKLTPGIVVPCIDEDINILENDNIVLKSESPKFKRNSECPTILKNRERKLSLDHTMLSRREGLSQSELDLHSIGKSPLERKSSFFRKKMDSFLKNTTEIFKRQSLGSKSQTMSRRGSMSVSLQSLNEKTTIYRDVDDRVAHSQQEVRGSTASIASGSTLGASEQDSVGSHPDLSASQPNVGPSDVSPSCVNGAQDSLLNSRAISMSSGLDSAFGQRRRKTSRSNRVTWVASEGLTNYLRRLTQDESNREIHTAHSYQDFLSIPENSLHEPKLDSKGRRLSYQRAVSGEDPVLSPRYQDSSLRRKPIIPEHSEANYELSNQLAEFSRSGIPAMNGYAISTSPELRHQYIYWAESQTNIDGVYDWSQLSPNEQARQAVIRELIITESDYLQHLICLVEVFIAAAHALQDGGRMLELDTSRLFSNIPDILNASLTFWETSFFPMIQESRENGTPFNPEYMATGFHHFREIMQPYEKYVNEQPRVLEYFRTISNNSDFMTYLQWCHSHYACKRLQLADLIIKPMQRLTKYAIILRRIITHTEYEPERTSLAIMESHARNYVLDINRSIRQIDEIEQLEQLANSIDVLEMEFKDDEIDKYFRMFSYLNLRAPMINCLPNHSRSIIFQGDLRFKDNVKELDVRVVLLTDMMLICKKLSKGSVYPYKLIRPKYMVNRMLCFPKFSTKNPKEVVSIIVVMIDEVGTACHAFSLSEPSKDANPLTSLKIWEQKLREGRLTYELSIWYARNPSRDLSELDVESSSDYGAAGTSKGSKQSSEDINIEREARERVATMAHGMSASTEYDLSQASIITDSFDVSGDVSCGRPPTLHSLRHPMQRNSTGGSSRQSRLSSFQQSTSVTRGPERPPRLRSLWHPVEQNSAAASSHHSLLSSFQQSTSVTRDSMRPPRLRSLWHSVEQASAGSSSHHTPRSSFQQSASAASHDEPQPGPSRCIYRAGSSVEHVITPQNPDDAVTSITVNVVSESESETVVASQQQAPMSHKVRSTGISSPNTLRVQPQSGVMALVHSLPDLTIDPSPPALPAFIPSPQTASEKLYQSHQELLQRNRLLAAGHHQYLTPDHRGTSYPPPSPTRAALRRGMAFSDSFKYPPLSKMGHVNSQSQQPPPEPQPGPSTSAGPRSEHGAVNPMLVPSTSTEKEKKKHLISSKNKGGGRIESSGSRRKDDKAE